MTTEKPIVLMPPPTSVMAPASVPADIDDVFLVRDVVFFAQRDGFIHKAFVADGTGVGDFDGDAVVERVAALQIARAVVARG